MRPEAIILDLDDTILDSGDPDTSLRRISSEYAETLDAGSSEQLFSACIEARDWFWNNNDLAREGRLDVLESRRTIFTRALSRSGVPQPDRGVVDAMARRYTTLRDEAIELFPSALPTLERLCECELKLGLLTNGATATQWVKIRQFGLERFFDHIQVEGDVGFGKPDLRAFQFALSSLGASSENTWMVGDNLLSDIQGAQGAGIYAVWMDAHLNGLDSESSVTPDAVVTSLDELLTLGPL